MSQKIASRENQQVIFLANIILSLVVLFFMTNTLDAFNYPKLMLLSMGVLALFLTQALRYQYPLRRDSLKSLDYYLFGNIVILILIASFNNLGSFHTLWGSFGRANGIITKVCLILITIVYFRYSNSETTKKFFFLITSLLILEGIYAVVQLNGADPIPWINPYNNIFVTTGNPNFAAALFAILVTLSFRFVFLAKTRTYRLLALIPVAGGSYFSYSTKSVQGILVIAFGIFLVGLIATIRFTKSRNTRFLSLTALLVPGVFILAGILNSGPLAKFLFQETLLVRWHYWKVAINILRDNLWSGVGNDSYGDYYRFYREEWFVDKYGINLISTNAHNVALQWGSDSGILGILIYLSFGLVATYVYLRKSNILTMRTFQDIDFIFIGFSCFYLQSLISISQLSVTVLGFAVLGILLSYARENAPSSMEQSQERSRRAQKSRSKSSYLGLGTIWLVFCLALIPISSSVVRNDLALRKALQLPGAAQEVSDLGPRSEAIRKAARPFLQDQDFVGAALQNLLSQGSASVGVELAEEALKTNPRLWVARQALISAFAQSGLYDKALAEAKEIIKLDPLNYDLQFNLADQAFLAGELELSKEYADKVVNIAPADSAAFKGAQNLLVKLATALP
jgi:O-antigen ligase